MTGDRVGGDSRPRHPGDRRGVPPTEVPAVDSRSRRPWRSLLGGNVLWLSAASFLNDASSEMIFPLLPLFLVGTLGAGPAFLGLIEGVAETTAAFFKLAGGWLSDRTGRRRRWIGGGYALAALTRPLMAAAAVPWHVLAIRFTDRVGKGIRSAPRDALLAGSVPRDLRGRAFGLHRAADHAGAMIGPLLASAVLLLWPGRLRLVFLLAFVPAALAALAVYARVREPPSPHGGEGSPERRSPREDDESRPKELDGAALRRPAFLGYLAAVVVFTLGNASDAFLLLRARDLGVAVALVPILWVALHVSKLVWNVAGGAMADRLGARPILVGGWLVYAATYGGFALATEAWHAWALFGLYGLYYGLTEPTEKVVVASLAPDRARARAFGAYHFATGIAALPASLVFGLVWQGWGAPAAFSLGALLALAATLLLPFVLRAGTREGAAAASGP